MRKRTNQGDIIINPLVHRTNAHVTSSLGILTANGVKDGGGGVKREISREEKEKKREKSEGAYPCFLMKMKKMVLSFLYWVFSKWESGSAARPLSSLMRQV